ncbi:hypothetical protein [Thiolapillus sp.]|uniref:hypothetical protein n=3 Tax=Thiolapillus sp. TaxID=2017437 RepID=UPI003AF94E52
MKPSSLVATEIVPLSEHFARLCRFLYCDSTIIEKSGVESNEPYDTQEFWEIIAEPLRIGGSIESTQVTTEFIEPGGSLMCSQAWDYECALSDITSLYTLEMTRFMWAWIAFENLSRRCCSDYEGKGPSGKVIEYLKTKSNNSELKGLAIIYAEAKSLVSDKILQTVTRAANCTDSSKYHYIHLCREIRNELFHSHKTCIEPYFDENDNTTLEDDPRIILLKTLSHLTLLSIQTILHAYFRYSDTKTGWLMTSQGIPNGIKLQRALEVLHLTEQSNVFQGQLDLN